MKTVHVAGAFSQGGNKTLSFVDREAKIGKKDKDYDFSSPTGDRVKIHAPNLTGAWERLREVLGDKVFVKKTIPVPGCSEPFVVPTWKLVRRIYGENPMGGAMVGAFGKRSSSSISTQIAPRSVSCSEKLPETVFPDKLAPCPVPSPVKEEPKVSPVPEKLEVSPEPAKVEGKEEQQLVKMIQKKAAVMLAKEVGADLSDLDTKPEIVLASGNKLRKKGSGNTLRFFVVGNNGAESLALSGKPGDIR